MPIAELGASPKDRRVMTLHQGVDILDDQHITTPFLTPTQYRSSPIPMIAIGSEIGLSAIFVAKKGLAVASPEYIPRS